MATLTGHIVTKGQADQIHERLAFTWEDYAAPVWYPGYNLIHTGHPSEVGKYFIEMSHDEKGSALVDGEISDLEYKDNSGEMKKVNKPQEQKHYGSFDLLVNLPGMSGPLETIDSSQLVDPESNIVPDDSDDKPGRKKRNDRRAG